MKQKVRTSKLFRHIGLYLVYCGSLLLIAGYATGYTQSNTLLIISAIMIIIGTILHIYRLKKESNY
ncbi:DUF3784 domain-containing protein [uncultured Prevotella sp.]|uniref:DUF3784 domain-containing protein n=1 Tax=uncultured Prevotella sp. TaxID=159272 RepID=UPI00345A7576